MEKTQVKKYVIFAPHIDDELIGCFRQLEAGLVSDVYYFNDLTEERMIEAEVVAKRYGFKAHFGWEFNHFLDPEVIILAPNINDAHPDHKAVNHFAKMFPNKKEYYSIDMNTKFDVLPVATQCKKELMLKTYYPSQEKLFEDEKYYLFESHLMSDTFKTIWVSFQKEGVHRYPAALEDPKLADVSFLGHPHRHMFHFKVWIEVFHDDRDIEFIQFKRWLESLYSDGTLELNYKSCEMMAEELYSKIVLKHNGRYVKISVSEDNENGCELEFK